MIGLVLVLCRSEEVEIWRLGGAREATGHQTEESWGFLCCPAD